MTTAQPAKSTGSKIGLFLALAVLLACVGGLVWFYVAFTPRGPAGPVLADAYFNSQVYVQTQLKAPSTAKFPNSKDPAVVVADLGGNAAQVTAYVDAQNSFGAMIRQHYTATLKWQHDDIWKVTDFKFTD